MFSHRSHIGLYAAPLAAVLLPAGEPTLECGLYCWGGSGQLVKLYRGLGCSAGCGQWLPAESPRGVVLPGQVGTATIALHFVHMLAHVAGLRYLSVEWSCLGAQGNA